MKYLWLAYATIFSAQTLWNKHPHKFVAPWDPHLSYSMLKQSLHSSMLSSIYKHHLLGGWGLGNTTCNPQAIKIYPSCKHFLSLTKLKLFFPFIHEGSLAHVDCISLWGLKIQHIGPFLLVTKEATDLITQRVELHARKRVHKLHVLALAHVHIY